MQDTNNELSAEELNVISDVSFFKLKKEISHKIEASLAILSEDISEILHFYSGKLPDDVLKIAPKISRGEQYKDLPWLILDYPRIFSDEAVFAFRTMFWWGNYFSFTVHLAGEYFTPVKRKIIANISMLNNKDFFLCVNKNQWQHHFEASNYKLLDELRKDEINSLLEETPFLKLGRKLPLHQFSKVIDFGEETYKEFLKVLY